MRTRILAFSALALLVALGVLGMHAMGIGHGSVAMSPTHMPAERAGHVSAPAHNAAEERQPPDEGHSTVLPALCVAILTAGFAVAALALAPRAAARFRIPPSSFLHRLLHAARSTARPPPLLVPLRS